MKKLIFSVLIFGAAMVSCSSDDSVITDSAASLIQNYVENNYPDATIQSKVLKNSTITATLNTGETITFTNSGTVISYASNYSFGIVADSLNTYFNDSISVDSVGYGRHGHHRGDSNGHSEKKDKGGKSGKGSKDGHRHGDHDLNSISIDSLSTTIINYINTNYSGFSMIHAEVDTICEGVVTEVMISSSSEKPIKLVFDAADLFLFKAERIQYSEVPLEVSNSVSSNYSLYTVMRRCELLTLTDNTLKYRVYLGLSGTRKIVTLLVDGTVTCEK